MKKLIFLITILIIFVSCDKLFLDVEGKEADLQGKWQLTSEDTVFFNFQNHLFQYQVYFTSKDTVYPSYGYYTLYGDTAIKLELLRQYSQISLDHLGWDTIPAQSYRDTIFKVFNIESLNNKKLVLSSNAETLIFDKF